MYSARLTALLGLVHLCCVVPLPEVVVPQHQRLVKRICSVALGIPHRAPYAVLCDSVNCLGLGVPRLGHRFPCKYNKGILLALNSHSSVTHNTLRSLILGPSSLGGVYPDRVLLDTWMAAHHLTFLPVSTPMLGDAPIHVHVVCCVVEGGVYIVSDGALKGSAVGCGAVVPDVVGMFAWAWSGTPPPPCLSYALVQATVGVGTVLIWYLILIRYQCSATT